MDDIDLLRLRLAEIQDELIATPSDDFGRRYALRGEQAELRDRVGELATDTDLERPSVELERELEALRAQIEAAGKMHIDLVAQTGGAGHGGSGAASYEIGVNRAIDDAQGISGLRARVARIEQILSRRET